MKYRFAISSMTSGGGSSTRLGVYPRSTGWRSDGRLRSIKPRETTTIRLNPVEGARFLLRKCRSVGNCFLDDYGQLLPKRVIALGSERLKQALNAFESLRRSTLSLANCTRRYSIRCASISSIRSKRGATSSYTPNQPLTRNPKDPGRGKIPKPDSQYPCTDRGTRS